MNPTSHALGSPAKPGRFSFNIDDDIFWLDDKAFGKIGRVGDLLDNAFTTNFSGRAADKFDRIIYEADSGKLFYDADGSGKKSSGSLFATRDKTSA